MFILSELMEVFNGMFKRGAAIKSIKSKVASHGEHKGPPKPAGAKPPAPKAPGAIGHKHH